VRFALCCCVRVLRQECGELMYMTITHQERRTTLGKTYAQSVGPVGQAALDVCCTMRAGGVVRLQTRRTTPKRKQYENDAPRRSSASTLAL
jgi:hypothetical protein